MGSSAKPPPPQKAAGPIRVSSADTAQAEAAERRNSRGRFDFSRTLIGTAARLPAGMQSTLGTP